MASITKATNAVVSTVDEHPRLVAAIQFGIILFFLLACILNDFIPVCHYVFGCDHRFGH